MNNLVLMTKYARGRMRRIFFMSYPENKMDYKQSRISYTVADSVAQTIAQLSGGTFLVMLMEELGISDGDMGIIASFGCVAAVMQLAAIKLSGRIRKNKLLVCFTALQRVRLAFIFFIPLLHMEQSVARVLMIVCYGFAQLMLQLGNPALIDWIASLVPTKVRGRYFAIKDAMAVLTVIISTLIMGIIVDITKRADSKAGFVILGATIGIMALINIIAMLRMKEPKLSCVDENGRELTGGLAKRKHKQEAEGAFHGSIKIFPALKDALCSDKFRKVLILNCLWVTSFYLASPFNASYQVKELELPYTYIMILSFVTSLLRVYLAPRAGKKADQIGMIKVTRWALTAMCGHYLTMAFSVPENAYITAAIAAVFSALGWTFISTGMFGIQLEGFDEEKRIVQYALFSIISGAYGFLVSVAVGKLINVLQKEKLLIGGRAVYAQQITNAAGLLFLLLTIYYLSRRMQQTKRK